MEAQPCRTDGSISPRLFRRLKRKREVSDYDDFYVASNEEAIEQYESAELIVNQVERYLMKMDINI